jgi:hypothetical protein
MGLVMLVVPVAAYLTGLVVLSTLVPDLAPERAAKLVGLAFFVVGGGAVARSAGRAARRIHDRRTGGHADTP